MCNEEKKESLLSRLNKFEIMTAAEIKTVREVLDMELWIQMALRKKFKNGVFFSTTRNGEELISKETFDFEFDELVGHYKNESEASYFTKEGEADALDISYDSNQESVLFVEDGIGKLAFRNGDADIVLGKLYLKGKDEELENYSTYKGIDFYFG